MEEKETNFNHKIARNYSVIKGRIGEALVEQIFRQLNFNIHRYGIEKTLPILAQSLKNKSYTGKVIESIRYQPDFVVYSDKVEPIFLEVKFYQDGKISRTELEKYEHNDTIFLLMTKDFMGCLKRSDLRKMKKTKTEIIFIEDCIPFEDFPDFKFSVSEKILVKGHIVYTRIFSDLMKTKDLNTKLKAITKNFKLLSKCFKETCRFVSKN